MPQNAITLKVELWSSVWPEIGNLFRLHHEELGDGTQIEVDSHLAGLMSEQGAMLIQTGRENSRLVGYCIWYLSKSLEHKGKLCAMQGPWFVRKEFRKGSLGLRLFKESLKGLEARGVLQAFPHTWAKSNPRLGSFLENLGARPLEMVYDLTLGAK